MITNLSKLDYEILEYISKFDSVSKEDIIRHFAKIDADVINQHVKKLAEPEYYSKASQQKPLTSYIAEFYNPMACYRILPIGKTAMVEYKEQRRRDRINNFWKTVVIVASLIAAVASIVAAINSM